jgi:hypothetical protein
VKNQKENLDDDEEEDSIEESDGNGLMTLDDNDILFSEEM